MAVTPSNTSSRARWAILTLISSLLVFPAIPMAGAAASELATITVRAWYRERILVPQDSRVHVSLQDVSRMDVAARVIAETAVDAKTGPPWEVVLAYDPGDLGERGEFVVRAWIERQDSLLFTTDSRIPAFDDEEAVDAMMIRVSGAASNDAEGSGGDLTGRSWVLVEAAGNPVDAGSGERQINLVFDTAAGSVSGSSGCNRFRGAFESDADRLRFGQMMATLMACEDGMELERQILQTLGKVSRFRIEGGELELLGDDGATVLRYRAE